MRAISLNADWEPKSDFVLGLKDVDGKLTYLGSKVWRNPRIEIVEKNVPVPGDDEVLVEVKASGICGSDVHMRTGKHFKKGEAVCSEEMIWCGQCRPCADGLPNHCERLEELGFSIDGAYSKYVKVNSRYVWSLEALRPLYGEEKMYELGSLVEPTSVAYNAVIERGGGIRPGENVVILGGGPIGAAACAILKRAGAAAVVLSEPSAPRRKMALAMGATHAINPVEVDVADEVLKITNGEGAKIILEATGLPGIVWPDVEKIIWEGKALNTAVVVVARADAKIPLTGEVLQVRRASVIGSQGHSGHGTFPNVISAMATGMDVSPMITKRIKMDEVEENLLMLQTDRDEVKITIKDFK